MLSRSVGSKHAQHVPSFARRASIALNIRHPSRATEGSVRLSGGNSLSSSSGSPHSDSHSDLKNIRQALSALLRRAPSSESIQEFNKLHEIALSTSAVQDKKVHELLLQAAAHERQPHIITQLLELAHQQSRQVRINVYEHISHHFAESKQWRYVRSFAELGRAHVGRWSTRLLDWRIRSLAELEEYTLLHDSIGWYAQEGLTPSRRTFEILVKASLSNRDIVWATQILRQMEQFGIPFGDSTYTAVLAGCRAFGLCPDVEARCFAILKNMGALNNIDVINTLMRLRLDVGDTDGARRIMSAAQSPTSDLNLELNHPTSNSNDPSLLHAFPPSPRLPPVISTPSRIRMPTVATYDILLRQTAHSGTLDQTISIYKSMLLSGTRPNDQIISSLIYVIFRASPSHWQDAVRIVSAAIYGHQSKKASGFCRKLGAESTGLSATFSDAAIPPVTPTTRIFNALLAGLVSFDTVSLDGLSTAFKRMTFIVRKMKCLGLEPDEETARIFMSFLDTGAGSSPSQVCDVLSCLTTRAAVQRETPSASTSGAIQPSSHSPTSVDYERPEPSLSLSSHHAVGLTRQALPEGSNPSSSAPIYATLQHVNIILQSINRNSRFWLTMKGRQTLHRIRDGISSKNRNRINVDRSLTSHDAIDSTISKSQHFLSISSHFTANPLLSHLDSLRRRGVRSDSRGFNLRMSHELFVNKDASRAQRTFDAMVVNGIKPLSSHYVTLMKPFAARGDLGSVKSVFAAAVASGIVVTVAMFTILIVAYGSAGDPHGARRVFGDMRNYGIKQDVTSLDALASAFVRSGQKRQAREVLINHWNAVVPANALRSDVNLRELSLKVLFQMLRGLSGAQRKGKRPASAMRRLLTKRLVRRVLKTWSSDSSMVPRRPTVPRSAEMRRMRPRG